LTVAFLLDLLVNASQGLCERVILNKSSNSGVKPFLILGYGSIELVIYFLECNRFIKDVSWKWGWEQTCTYWASWDRVADIVVDESEY
jgi:hypothetical protein